MSSSTNDEFEALRKRLGVPVLVEPGWQQIVLDAVERIEWLLARDALTKVEWSEIKMWHGTLAIRFRFVCANDDVVVMRLVEDVVTAAKVRADRTCMVCGNGGGRFVEDSEQLRVLCRQHEFGLDQHRLDEDQVRAMVSRKFTALAVIPMRKRAWRVIGGHAESAQPGKKQVDTSNWSEVREDGVEYVDLVEVGGVEIYRERDRARHRASAELVRVAVDEEFERMELNFGIVEVREGVRPGEWVVVIAYKGKTSEEIWFEDEGMPAEREVRTRSVRLVQMRD
jgi:hypothetical protein